MSSAPPNPTTLRLRVVCLTPPAANAAAADEIFGLQNKHGQLDAGVVQPDGSVVYELTVLLARPAAGAALRLRGPLVHGSAGEPFLYLSLRDPQSGAWVRRLKIALGSITEQQVARATATEQGYLAARISGSGSGSVPLLDGGWVAGS